MQVKFRGKRVDGGGWVVGSLIGDNVIVGKIIDFNDEYFNTEFWYKVEPSSIGMFTGLTDKNGKEIYGAVGENGGCIVKSRFYPLGVNKEAIEYYKIGIIVWNNFGFGCKLKITGTKILNDKLTYSYHLNKKETYKHPTQGDDWIDMNFYFNECEIIGNAFDNPELLEK